MQNKKDAKDFLKTMSLQMMTDYMAMASKKDAPPSVIKYLGNQVSTLVVVMSMIENLVDDTEDDGDISKEEMEKDLNSMVEDLKGAGLLDVISVNLDNPKMPPSTEEKLQDEFLNEFLKGMK